MAAATRAAERSALSKEADAERDGRHECPGVQPAAPRRACLEHGVHGPPPSLVRCVVNVSIGTATRYRRFFVGCCEDFIVSETEPNAIGPPVGVIVSTDATHFDAMATFYADILALPVRSRYVGFVNFVWGNFRLTIHVHSDVAGPAVDPDRVMINLSVTDVVAVHERLVHAGVEFRRPPEREPWGGWIATFADPDGNTLQLMQLPG